MANLILCATEQFSISSKSSSSFYGIEEAQKHIGLPSTPSPITYYKLSWYNRLIDLEIKILNSLMLGMWYCFYFDR